MTNTPESDELTKTGEAHDLDALGQVISALKELAPEDRQRILETVATFFKIKLIGLQRSLGGMPDTDRISVRPGLRAAFSADTTMSPKEFLLQKQPRTDVERVACLAYYLTHYRDTPHFRTLDVSKLNTEAAQPKFANTAYSVNNALKQGYLAPGPKGSRQLGAAGEQFVLALPDRETGRGVMAALRPRARVRRKEEGSSKESLASMSERK